MTRRLVFCMCKPLPVVAPTCATHTTGGLDAYAFWQGHERETERQSHDHGIAAALPLHTGELNSETTHQPIKSFTAISGFLRITLAQAGEIRHVCLHAPFSLQSHTCRRRFRKPLRLLELFIGFATPPCRIAAFLRQSNFYDQRKRERLPHLGAGACVCG